MLLKKLKLSNIRTYRDETIEFPASSIMLSGDIGCGKSSILIAIEFALFGILRGNFSGESLLRKGCDKGSVELEFEIDNNNYVVKRGLKRSQRGINQENGYVIENGVKTEGTPLELKNKVIELLGYPSSETNASKSLLYRYTVFTPQEEMKSIIEEKEERRLDVLRKVFNMDKYKRIKDNTQKYLGQLKDELIHLDSKVEELPEKQKEKERIKKESGEVKEQLDALKEKEPKIKEEKKDVNSRMSECEDDLKKLNNLRNELSVNETNLNNYIEKINNDNKKIEDNKKKKEELEKELEGKSKEDSSDLKEKVNKLKEEIDKLEKEEREKSSKIMSLQNEIKECNELVSKISSLDTCPTCKQPVKAEYKENVKKENEDKIESKRKEIENLKSKESGLKEKKEELERLNKRIEEVNLVNYKFKNLEEYKKNIEELEKEVGELKKKVGEVNEKKSELNNEIEKFKEVEDKYKEIKKEYESVVEKERKFYMRMSELEAKEKEWRNNLNKLEEEIKYLEELKEKSKKKKSLRNWLKDHFTNLMGLVESHVMLRIQQEFDCLFKEWFDFLLEDENISGRLDESFSPIIEQDGYEIEFGDLSGGERTSAALSYRLALNKVINDLLDNLKTKDIIVLDEPTDGFSSQQLDKLKDMLDKLNMKQVIIVSHESKIESMVESVIKIEKNENESYVSS